MPLALVLAARRLTDPGQDLATLIAQASQELLSLCQDERLRHLPPRLRSVRASLLLSYERLSPPARALFARLSFFPGGLDRSFAPLNQVLGETWQQLVQDEVAAFALARYDRQRDRYTLLQPVLELAREQLDQGEGDAFRRQAVELWTAAAQAYVPLLQPSQLGPEALAGLGLPDDAEERRAALEQRRLGAFSSLLAQEDNVIGAAAWALAAGEAAGDVLLRALDPYLDLRALWRTQEQLYRLAAARAAAAGE